MRGIVVLPCPLVLVVSCGGGDVAAAAPRPAAFAGVPLLDLVASADRPGGAEHLLGYRWAGRGTVPWPFDETPGRLPFGPAGRTPSTLLYLTFDGPLERETAEQAPHWSLEMGGAGPTQDGRFGGGCRLLPGERLALRCAAEPTPSALTLEFWIRPESVKAGPILTVPGLLELRCQRGGALDLEVRAAKGPTTSSPATLAPGRWSHVGIVVDPEELQVTRLVLDDQARMSPLASADALPPLERLELGGAGLDGIVDELRVSDRPANTSELIETWEARPEPLEELELSTTGGVRSLEVWTAFLREPVVDDAAEWASGHLEHVLSDADGLRWAQGDWQRVRALDPPLARTCHPTVSLGDGRLFVFSGEVRDSHLGPMRNTPDTWLFHTREERWERLPTSLAPPGRCHQQAAYSPDHDLVLMSTGWGNGDMQNLNYDDTWVFHVAEQRWEQRKPSGDKLRRGSEHALVYHPGLRRFFLFEGDKVLDYDPELDHWTLHRPSVTDEQGRPFDYDVPFALSAAYDPASDAVVLFGGQRWKPVSFCDRTLLYEPRSDRFVVLDVPEGPTERVRPGFAYDPVRKQVVLFGGVLDQYSQRMDDLWSFDPARRRWTRLEASGTPSARGGYMLMAYEPELDRFFLVCGRNAPERFLEEVWSLSLAGADGRARYAFDRAAFAARDWFWEGETPGDSALEFRFRGSGDALSWGEWSPSAPPADRYVEVDVRLHPGSGGARPLLRSMGFR